MLLSKYEQYNPQLLLNLRLDKGPNWIKQIPVVVSEYTEKTSSKTFEFGEPRCMYIYYKLNI